MNGVEIALTGAVMAVGLIGTLIPLVPGLPLIWGAGLVFGIVEGFSVLGWIAFTLMTALLVAGTIAKIVLPHRRLRGRGVPTSTLVAGAILGVIGFFVIPIVGLLIGAVGGVLLAERSRSRDWTSAWASTKQVIIGYGIGAVVEVAAGAGMVACWVTWLAARG